ncbi:hypothetical protein [Microbulbifer epialgicus]|uniref:Uncharacterized protein n=1 Tax=Microbulbifer epialgicus TaxID=393907 RepID=A0ABV4NU18_9GAMM
MATTNLDQMKHINGQPVTEADVKVGLAVMFPTAVGGSVKYECVSKKSDVAEFKSQNKNWPDSFDVRFSQPEFTVDEFENLAEALRKFNTSGEAVTSEERSLVLRAQELGYARQFSHTQASWTEKGVESSERAHAAKNASKG